MLGQRVYYSGGGPSAHHKSRRAAQREPFKVHRTTTVKANTGLSNSVRELAHASSATSPAVWSAYRREPRRLLKKESQIYTSWSKPGKLYHKLTKLGGPRYTPNLGRSHRRASCPATNKRTPNLEVLEGLCHSHLELFQIVALRLLDPQVLNVNGVKALPL